MRCAVARVVKTAILTLLEHNLNNETVPKASNWRKNKSSSSYSPAAIVVSCELLTDLRQKDNRATRQHNYQQ